MLTSESSGGRYGRLPNCGGDSATPSVAHLPLSDSVPYFSPASAIPQFHNYATPAITLTCAAKCFLCGISAKSIESIVLYCDIFFGFCSSELNWMAAGSGNLLNLHCGLYFVAI